MGRFRWAAAAALLLAAAAAHAQEFRLFGATFGMTRAELAKVWVPLEGNNYYIKDSAVFDLSAEFDHGDRLWQVNFSVPIDEKHNPAVAATAFQNVATRLWGGSPGLLLGVRTGKGSGGVTVTHKRMQAEYVQYIETQLAPLLRP